MEQHKKPNIFGTDYITTPRQRLMETLGIFAYFICTLACSYKMYTLVTQSIDAIWGLGLLVFAILAAYVAADFVSGLVHWMGDTFGEPDWPILGATFIQPFRLHHVEPEEITEHDFISTNGNTSVVLMLFLVPVTIIAPASMGHVSFFILSFSLFFSFSIFLTNQFHKWAHTSNPTPMVKTLQRFSLVLTPKVHDIHHTSPFKESYCITNGWLNPLLDRIGLWRILERGMSMITKNDYSGIAAVHHTNVDETKPPHMT